MTVRVGVDVGGTFTKAVAVRLADREVVAEYVLPTTHDAPQGVAEGVVRAVAAIAEAVGADQIEMVTHSTTQAVNALLEGDVGEVGVIAMGRRPDTKRVDRLTRLENVELAPGKRLRVRQAFFDVTDGLPSVEVSAALTAMADAGVSAIAVAEAFSPDDSSNEDAVATLATEAGLPVCRSTELSGLYGLELRTVTAALNASIVPIAMDTAAYVAEGVRAAGIDAPVMVMRSDGGATDLAGFTAAPVRTLYSGPSASVAGALRYTGVTDAIVIEVGGTSTNVAAIRNGRPALSYVRVASHATALRSVDVRVIGVAGGSMLRVRRGLFGLGVHGVGPRSAHIAGLPYACFLAPDELRGARPVVGPVVAGDPPDYLTLELADGRRAALTVTCAANARGVTRPGDYAMANAESAAVAFEVAAEQLRASADEIAERMLNAAGEATCELALQVAKAAKLTAPALVGVGGGAGGLARHAAAMLGWTLEIPPRAEVISSIGDALSMLRAERERTMSPVDPAEVERMLADAQAEVIAAGASPTSVELRVEEVPERSLVRAIATGAVGLASGALPGRQALDADEVRAMHPDYETFESHGPYWLAGAPPVVAIIDRYGDVIERIDGRRAAAGELAGTIDALTRYRGPITLRPSVWVVDGARILELASFDVAANPYENRAPGDDPPVYIVGRSC